MTKPLWIDPEEQSFPALEGDIAVDVAIIGAGFSGVGAAWALRDEDVSVAVLEARTVASGASGRNAGFVLTGPAMGFSDSVRAIGLEQTLAIWALTRRNQETLSELVAELELDCGYLRRGSMTLAASEEEWQKLLLDLEGMASGGIGACRVDRSSLPIPFDRMYQGGIYIGGNAEMDPGTFLRGLARALGSRIEIFECTGVDRFEPAGAWRLRTPGGMVTASRVVVAANAHAAQLLPVPIAPTRGQVLATEPMDRTIVPFPMYANRGFQYWRQTASGRLIVGGWRDWDLDTEVGHEESLNPVIQQALDQFARAVHARAAPAITYRWAGIMGFTPDHMPLVGAVPGMDGMSIAAGYSGHGVAMAFECGALAAGLAAGRPMEIPATFDPARFV